MNLPPSPSKQLNFLSNNTNDKQAGCDNHEKPNPFSALGRDSIPPGYGQVGPPNLAGGG